MPTPPELLPRVAKLPPSRATCAVTGLPARYRDPATGLPYATLDAYKELQRRSQQQQHQRQMLLWPEHHQTLQQQQQQQQQQQAAAMQLRSRA